MKSLAVGLLLLVAWAPKAAESTVTPAPTTTTTVAIATTTTAPTAVPGCAAQPTISTDATNADLAITSWTQCNNDTEVRLIAVTGATHSLGSDTPTRTQPWSASRIPTLTPVLSYWSSC